MLGSSDTMSLAAIDRLLYVLQAVLLRVVQMRMRDTTHSQLDKCGPLPCCQARIAKLSTTMHLLKGQEMRGADEPWSMRPAAARIICTPHLGTLS